MWDRSIGKVIETSNSFLNEIVMTPFIVNLCSKSCVLALKGY